MKLLRKGVVAALISTLLLIFIGGLVRVSGAGLGCPDWPHCFGAWIPPTSTSDLPADIDPALFNFTLAWIEYVNRLAGVIVGLIIVAVMVQAYRAARHDRRILIPSVLSALLVSFQGWLGSVVVSSRLEHAMISLHLGLALVLISLLIYLLRRVDLRLEPSTGAKRLPKFEKAILAIWGLSLIQIVIGTEVRGEVEGIRSMFPLLSDVDVVARLGDTVTLHSVLGVAMVIASWYITANIFNDFSGLQSAAWGLVGLVLLQMILGMAMFSAGIKPLLQVIHLWAGSLFLALLTHIYVSIKEIE